MAASPVPREHELFPLGLDATPNHYVGLLPAEDVLDVVRQVFLLARGGVPVVCDAVEAEREAVEIVVLVRFVAMLEFVVALAADEIVVKRLGWTTRLPLDDLRSVAGDNEVMSSSLRLFGNGGLLTTVAWGVDGRVDYALEASVFVTGTDLLLFTNYSGLDPIVNGNTAAVGGSGASGIDYGNFPIPRGINFGLRAGF